MFCLTGKGFSWQFASNFLYYKPAQDAKSPRNTLCRNTAAADVDFLRDQLNIDILMNDKYNEVTLLL